MGGRCCCCLVLNLKTTDAQCSRFLEGETKSKHDARRNAGRWNLDVAMRGAGMDLLWRILAALSFDCFKDSSSSRWVGIDQPVFSGQNIPQISQKRVFDPFLWIHLSIFDPSSLLQRKRSLTDFILFIFLVVCYETIRPGCDKSSLHFFFFFFNTRESLPSLHFPVVMTTGFLTHRWFYFPSFSSTVVNLGIQSSSMNVNDSRAHLKELNSQNRSGIDF